MRSLLLLLPITACQPPGDTGVTAPSALQTEAGLYTASLDWQPDPPAQGEQLLRVTLDGAEVLGESAHLGVELWMPEHDHGLTDPPQLSTADGVTAATWIWSMPGTWELTLTFTGDAGEDTAAATFDVE